MRAKNPKGRTSVAHAASAAATCHLSRRKARNEPSTHAMNSGSAPPSRDLWNQSKFNRAKNAAIQPSHSQQQSATLTSDEETQTAIIAVVREIPVTADSAAITYDKPQNCFTGA